MSENARGAALGILPDLQILQPAGEKQIRSFGRVSIALELGQAGLRGPRFIALHSQALFAEPRVDLRALCPNPLQFRLIGIQELDELFPPRVRLASGGLHFRRLGGELRLQAGDLGFDRADLLAAGPERLEQSIPLGRGIGELRPQDGDTRVFLADHDLAFAGLPRELGLHLSHLGLQAQEITLRLAALRLQLKEILDLLLLLGGQLVQPARAAEVRDGGLGALQRLLGLRRLSLDELARADDLLKREDARALQVLIQDRIRDVSGRLRVGALHPDCHDIRIRVTAGVDVGRHTRGHTRGRINLLEKRFALQDLDLRIQGLRLRHVEQIHQ